MSRFITKDKIETIKTQLDASNIVKYTDYDYQQRTPQNPYRTTPSQSKPLAYSFTNNTNYQRVKNAFK